VAQWFGEQINGPVEGCHPARQPSF
jgi:hypothetical protein